MFALGQLAVAGLVYTGNLHYAMSLLWRRIVRLSLDQKKRKAGQKRDNQN
jgi:hypothetical protein